MVRDAVVEVLVGLGIPAQRIQDGTHLKGDLQLDSTEIVEVALEMKRRFAVSVALESSSDPTVRDVADLVEQQLHAAVSAAEEGV